MKDSVKRRRSVCYLVLDIVFAALTVCAVIFVTLSFFAESASGGKKRLERYADGLRALFDRLELVSALATQNNWVSELAVKSDEEMRAISPVDKIGYGQSVRSFNSVIGMECETALYFTQSDFVLYSEGLSKMSEYMRFFYDPCGENLADPFFAGPYAAGDRGRFLGGLQFYYLGNVSDAVVCLKPSYQMPAVKFLYVFKKAYFENLAYAALSETDRVSVTADDAYLYGAGEYRFAASIPYYGVRITLSAGVAAGTLIWELALTLAAAGALYLLARLALSKVLYGMQSRIRTLNRILRQEDDASGGLIAKLDEAVAAMRARDEALREQERKNSAAIIGAYLRLLLDGKLALTESVADSLRFVGLDPAARVRVTVFREAPDGPVRGYLVDKRILVQTEGFDAPFGKICGSGRVHEGLAATRESFSEANAAYAQAVVHGEQDVRYETLPAFEGLGFTPQQFIHKLKTHIVNRSFEQCRFLLANTFRTIEEGRPDPQAVVAFFRSVAGALVELAGGLADVAADCRYLDETAAEYRRKLERVIERIVRQAVLRKEDPSASHFEAVKAYIDEHYTESTLSLKSIAAHFHYSASYISRIFSENGDFLYLQYINLLRVEKAKQLMRENVKINEVAARCGFESAVTFRKTFKKYTGTTPADYRNVVMKLS